MQVSREKEEIKMLAGSFNFMFCYIDDVLSLNNPTFGDYGDLILQELKQIYRIYVADSAFFDIPIIILFITGCC